MKEGGGGGGHVQERKTHKKGRKTDTEIITPIKYLLSMELKDCDGDNLRKQLLLEVISPPIC